MHHDNWHEITDATVQLIAALLTAATLKLNEVHLTSLDSGIDDLPILIVKLVHFSKSLPFLVLCLSRFVCISQLLGQTENEETPLSLDG